MPTPAQCIERFSEIEISPESREYLRYHACRFSYLIGEVKRAAKARDGAECRILDVGLAYQTTLLRDALPRAIVNSLGYFDERFPARPGEVHFPFDLNEAQYPERCPAPAMKHDVIVMAEVIEHLYTAPRLVLRQPRRLAS